MAKYKKIFDRSSEEVQQAFLGLISKNDKIKMLEKAFDTNRILADAISKVCPQNVKNGVLENACSSGNLKLVEYCQTIGADFGFDGNLPLFVAVNRGHIEIVKYLLNNCHGLTDEDEIDLWINDYQSSNPELALVLHNHLLLKTLESI